MLAASGALNRCAVSGHTAAEGACYGGGVGHLKDKILHSGSGKKIICFYLAFITQYFRTFGGRKSSFFKIQTGTCGSIRTRVWDGLGSSSKGAVGTESADAGDGEAVAVVVVPPLVGPGGRERAGRGGVSGGGKGQLIKIPIKHHHRINFSDDSHKIIQFLFPGIFCMFSDFQRNFFTFKKFLSTIYGALRLQIPRSMSRGSMN